MVCVVNEKDSSLLSGETENLKPGFSIGKPASKADD
jgi:hypothetical protein